MNLRISNSTITSVEIIIAKRLYMCLYTQILWFMFHSMQGLE